MQFQLLILALSLSFFSCSNKLLTIKNPLEFASLTMQRTACYGTCPQYTVSILNNGYVKYEGKNFVDKIGCHYSTISMETLSQINDYISDINFFSLDSVFNAPMTDVPSVIIEVKLNSDTHKVIDRFNGPKALKDFQKFIDTIINSITTWSLCDVSIE
jgi:hypothetical protein